MQVDHSTVLALQLLSIAFTVFIGVMKGWGKSGMLLLSVGLITPVPIASVGNSTSGFLYWGDIIGVLALGKLVLSGRIFRKKIFSVQILSVFLLVVLPLLSTCLLLLEDQNFDLRFMLLGLFRGALYCGIFLYFTNYGGRFFAEPGLLKAQITVFSIYSLIAIGQFVFHYNVDYWNSITEVDHVQWTHGFGAGYMGLYRGAVGAWSALLMIALPIVFLTSSRDRILFPLLFVLLLSGSLIVGSRQGLFFSILGAFIGIFFTYVILMCRGQGFSEFLTPIKFGTAAIIFIVAAVITLRNTYFVEWFLFRFELFYASQDITSELANRDPRFPALIARMLDSPMSYVLGLGEGRRVPNPPGEINDLIYVDSEYLWVIQKIGVIGLVLYLLFFVASIRTLLGLPGGQKGGSELKYLTIGILIVGLGLCYGHYFLLHVESSQAPVSLWLWAILGSAFYWRRKIV